jgi:nucleoside-diphosphate-sugar epimerase
MPRDRRRRYETTEMDKLFLTGARGFIGRHCITGLVDAGFEVHAVVSSAPLPSVRRGVVWHQADLLCAAQATALIEAVAPTTMLHLAWVTTPGQYWTSPLNARWRRASVHLIEQAAVRGLERLVVVGTCAEYDWTDGACIEGKTPLKPASAYSNAKHELRLAINALSKQYSFSTAWARPFFVFGPGEPAERFVPSIITNLMHNQPAACTDGHQRRDYIYVKDVAAALVTLLQSNLFGPINIGTGQAPAIRQIATTIGRLMDKPQLIQLGARQVSQPEPPLVVADTTRLHDELGFKSHWDLEAGLTDTIAAALGS